MARSHVVKIAYLHQYYVDPDTPGGGGTRSYEFARRLAAAGHEVDIITADNTPAADRGAGWQVRAREGFRIHSLPVPYDNKMSYARRIRAFLAFAMGSAGMAAAMRADVVFATSTPLTICLPGTYAARRSRAPMVFEVRDLWPEMPIAMGALNNGLAIAAARWLERLAYRSAAEVIALSPGMAAGVRRTGVPDERIHVIPNGCDLTTFGPDRALAAEVRASHEWLGDRPLVVYTGTFGLVNGVSYLVDVAAQAARLDPEVRFLLVGGGMEAEKVRARARELQVLDKNLFVMGSRPKREVVGILAAADIATSSFIDLPEMWNNSANKFFDALASGTAIAINYQGWQAELLREWDAGLVLDAQDHAAAAHDLVTALRTPGWTERAGANARRLAEAEFSRDDLAERFIAVLEKAHADHMAKRGSR